MLRWFQNPFLLQFQIFDCYFVRFRKNTLNVAMTTPPIFLLIFLVSIKNLKYRYEMDSEIISLPAVSFLTPLN